MPVAEERLLAFYSSNGRDILGRTHTQILGWSDAVLEAVHDYIQWLFPLPEPSSVNPLAPLLTPRLVQCFRASELVQARFRASLQRMLLFYGLGLERDGRVAPVGSFALRAQTWLTPSNHNYLRLTRMLRSLHLVGLKDESAALLAALIEIYERESRGQGKISAETLHYWQRARE